MLDRIQPSIGHPQIHEPDWLVPVEDNQAVRWPVKTQRDRYNVIRYPQVEAVVRTFMAWAGVAGDRGLRPSLRDAEPVVVTQPFEKSALDVRERAGGSLIAHAETVLP